MWWRGVAVQVLHMDRNDYYGGAAASLNLNQVSDAMGVTLAEFDVCHLVDVVFFNAFCWIAF
jgi:RAB protein geranylgeranyltransferase component A